ncbi:hypothetical protein KKG71_00215 [Patescibacteria group bacterium]|nr:hypothetical protein [Patescibacteria group bacterium]
MSLICIEVEGATYEPENIFQINDFFVIPATKNSSVLEGRDQKLILVFNKKREDKNFIFCYQFLFLKSNIYYYCSLPGKPIEFNKEDSIDDISKEYEPTGGFKINFNKIDIFHTSLPKEIDFNDFYNKFSEKYREDENFKNIIDLFLYTIGSKNKFYDNIFQKIAQLQTIFETLTGKPGSEPCAKCKRDKYNEDWGEFLKRKLTEKGLTNEDENSLIIKIKTMLNRGSRVKYIHHSAQLNTWQKTIEEIKTGNCHHKDKQTYTTNFEDILKEELKIDEWSALDWENVFSLYQTIIKRIIFSEYLNN